MAVTIIGERSELAAQEAAKISGGKIFMKQPKRKISLELHINADDWDQVEGQLRNFLFELRSKGRINEQVWGSPSCGGYTEVTIDPEMTHEKYHELNDKYVDFLRSQPREPKP